MRREEAVYRIMLATLAIFAVLLVGFWLYLGKRDLPASNDADVTPPADVGTIFQAR